MSTFLVINLNRSIDRLNRVRDMFKENGIENWVRIEAIDGRKVDKEDVDKNTTFFCSKFCGKGMVGCAMSHLKAWKYIVDNNLENVVILEDDAIFIKDFKDKFNLLLQHTPNDYDVLYLGYFGFTFLLDPIVRVNSKNKVDNKYIFTPKKGVRACIGYMLSNRGARKLLECVDKTKIYQHIDFQLNNSCYKTGDIVVYASNEKLVTTPTDIKTSSNFTSKRPYFLNFLLKQITTDETSLDYMFSTEIYQIDGYSLNLYRILLISWMIFVTLHPSKKLKIWTSLVHIFVFGIDIFFIESKHDLYTLILDQLIFLIPVVYSLVKNMRKNINK